MTPITREEAAIAYASGESVECQVGNAFGHSRWTDVTDYGHFDVPNLTFRRKPKPLEMWANLYPNGLITTYMTKRAAIECSMPACSRIAVLMREVTE